MAPVDTQFGYRWQPDGALHGQMANLASDKRKVETKGGGSFLLGGPPPYKGPGDYRFYSVGTMVNKYLEQVLRGFCCVVSTQYQLTNTVHACRAAFLFAQQYKVIYGSSSLMSRTMLQTTKSQSSSPTGHILRSTSVLLITSAQTFPVTSH